MATAEPPAQDAAAKDEDPYRTKFSKLRKELLDKLNRIKPGNGRTLRLYEKGEAPCVYQIVVNKIDEKNVIEGDDEGFWKLVKVGRTAADTTQKCLRYLRRHLVRLRGRAENQTEWR